LTDFTCLADIKELEEMLKDEAMSSNDMSYVETALQKFQKAESQAKIGEARVIGMNWSEMQLMDFGSSCPHSFPLLGTTCVASVFEIFNDVTAPLVLLDEASQIMEPMAMVPISKFGAERLILIGDPLQVSVLVKQQLEKGRALMF
jgi:hypothetical protein